MNRSKLIRLLWQVPLAIGGLWFLISIMMCAGIVQVPMLMPHRSLQGHLTNDFGCSLPSSAIVHRGTHAGGRDPASFYLVEIPSPDRDAFLQQVRSAAVARGHDVVVEAPDQSSGMGKRPDWWNPQSAHDVERFDITVEPPAGSTHGYFWYHSSTSDDVFIFWFDT